MNRTHSLFAVALASFALSSVACAAPQGSDDEENASASSMASTRDDGGPTGITNPAPRPVLVTCVTITGNHTVTQAQCETLLRAQGCKPGAVVNDKQKCSTASDPAAPSRNPDDFANPDPEAVPVTCVTITGKHEVTQAQCETLLRAQGCKPGAVVGGEQKCSTTQDPPAPSGNPDDLANPDPERVPVTCVTITGSHQVTQAQCETLLRAQGCKPGAVVGDKQTCSTT